MYVPAVVYVEHVGLVAVIELLALLTGPVPAPLVALTLNVYEVPSVKPVTLIGEEDPVPVMQPGVEIAVYPVIEALPVQDGALNVTAAQSFDPAVAVPIVGEPGLRGHIPSFAYVVAWHTVQIPGADVAVGTTGVPLIIPPGYFLLIYGAPTQVVGNVRVFPGQTMRTAPQAPFPALFPEP